MAARILVVQHEDDDPIHLIGAWMVGVELDVCLAFKDDPVPPDLDGYDGLVVMGGVMGANDDATTPWLTPTKELVRDAADRGVPTLGICLGHQLAAVALGGEVQVNPLGRQFGLMPVGWEPEAADDPLFSAVRRPDSLPARAMQWNDDVVTRLPDGGRPLAHARTGELQAARHAPTVWGIQWHPEVDGPLVRRWVAESTPADGPAGGPADGPADALTREVEAVDAAAGELELTWRPLAVRFGELAAAYAGTP